MYFQILGYLRKLTDFEKIKLHITHFPYTQSYGTVQYIFDTIRFLYLYNTSTVLNGTVPQLDRRTASNKLALAGIEPVTRVNLYC